MSVHTLHLIIVFALVATVFTAFLREWASPDLVALGAMGVLLVTGRRLPLRIGAWGWVPTTNAIPKLCGAREWQFASCSCEYEYSRSCIPKH